MYSCFLQIVEYLPCAGHCSRHWEFSSKTHQTPAVGGLALSSKPWSYINNCPWGINTDVDSLHVSRPPRVQYDLLISRPNLVLCFLPQWMTSLSICCLNRDPGCHSDSSLPLTYCISANQQVLPILLLNISGSTSPHCPLQITELVLVRGSWQEILIIECCLFLQEKTFAGTLLICCCCWWNFSLSLCPFCLARGGTGSPGNQSPGRSEWWRHCCHGSSQVLCCPPAHHGLHAEVRLFLPPTWELQV